MALVIDCYNLLHQTMPASLAGLDENRLCRLLAAGPWRGQTIIVVCDGRPKPHALGSPVDEVELRYSLDGSADEQIMAIIDADHSPRRLTVVSSDRQIQKHAQRRRCVVVPCDRFVTTLAQRRPAAATTSSKTQRGPLPASEVQRWIDAFGVDEKALDAPAEKPWKRGRQR